MMPNLNDYAGVGGAVTTARCFRINGGVSFLIMCVIASGLWADTIRTQTVSLSSGWNSVFLEVEPFASSPSAVMSNTPVDIVASFFDPGVAPQFVSNPSANLFKEAGWGVWYAESRPDAFLKSLYAIYGQRAYLIHATNAFTLAVTGTVIPAKIQWTPDAFNFAGFAVSSSAPPTFDQFFAGSPALHHNKIYRLVNGVWRQVVTPASETMRAGEAFWIFCSGSTTYQGPLTVATTTSRGLVLGLGGDKIVLRNLTAHPVTPTLEHVASGSDAVPFMVVVQAMGALASPIQAMGVPQPVGNWSLPLPPIEAGAALAIPMEASADLMTLPVHKSLLKVATDVGTETWIPVIGLKSDTGAK